MNNDSKEIIKLFNNLLNYNFDKNNHSPIFDIYRFYYLYSVIKKYIVKSINLDDIINKTIPNILKSKISNNTQFLEETFIKKNNLYLSTYFNNSIKYLLPLPYELLFYYPLLSFRKGGKIYKHLDKLDSIQSPIFFDKLKKKTLTKMKNVDSIKNEIELNLDINLLYDLSQSESYSITIIIILDEQKNMYIYAGSFNDKNNFNVLFERIIIITKMNTKIYTNFGIGFEAVFPSWRKTKKTIKIDYNKIYYAQIYKKIQKDDFFNSFPEISIDSNKFGYLFRNCDKNVKLDLNIQLYTYFFPNSNVLFRYLDNTYCIIYKLNKTIDKVLDINRSIVTVNPFITTNSDKKNIFFDNKKIKLIETAKQGELKLKVSKDTIEDDLYKCVSIDEKIEDFIKKNPDCDINQRHQYSAKRRFYEVIYKTRRYDPSTIYTDLKFREKLPKSINLNHFIYDIHRPIDMYNIDINHFDGFILRAFNINGFISTDFELIFNTGNELFITFPNRYITEYAKSTVPCFKNENSNFKLINQKDNLIEGAYIYTNINETNYKDAMINYLSLLDLLETSAQLTMDIVGIFPVGFNRKIQRSFKSMRLIEIDNTIFTSNSTSNIVSNLLEFTNEDKKIIIKEPYDYIFIDNNTTAKKGSDEYKNYENKLKNLLKSLK